MSIEKYPKINESQFTLYCAEISTGIVLDINLKYAISQNQKVFTIYDRFDLAKEEAKRIVAYNDNIECIISDYSDNAVLVLTKDDL